MYLELYDETKKDIWNKFVLNSCNGNFIFIREYMDYHSSRFTDNSLMFYNEKGVLLALLPANINDDILISHEGLTYSGFILDKNIKTTIMIEMFKILIDYCKEINITSIIYKTIPYIYHEIPCQEDLYALFINDARLYERNISSTIKIDSKKIFETRRKRQIKKAINNNLIFKESYDYERFWNVLQQNLLNRYDRKPVHTLEEIIKLNKLFPQNIRLFCTYKGENLLAGVLIYESNKTSHAQYISANEEGKKLGALDLIFDILINNIYRDKQYFDFGISNENNGKYLNEGLINQKEGFGASGVIYDKYIINL